MFDRERFIKFAKEAVEKGWTLEEQAKQLGYSSRKDALNDGCEVKIYGCSQKACTQILYKLSEKELAWKDLEKREKEVCEGLKDLFEGLSLHEYNIEKEHRREMCDNVRKALGLLEAVRRDRTFKRGVWAK